MIGLKLSEIYFQEYKPKQMFFEIFLLAKTYINIKELRPSDIILQNVTLIKVPQKTMPTSFNQQRPL